MLATSVTTIIIIIIIIIVIIVIIILFCPVLNCYVLFVPFTIPIPARSHYFYRSISRLHGREDAIRTSMLDFFEYIASGVAAVDRGPNTTAHRRTPTTTTTDDDIVDVVVTSATINNHTSDTTRSKCQTVNKIIVRA